MPGLLEVLDRDLYEVVKQIEEDIGKIDCEIKDVDRKVDQDLEELVSEYRTQLRIDPEQIKLTYRPSLISHRLKSLEGAKQQLNSLRSEILTEIKAHAGVDRKTLLCSTI